MGRYIPIELKDHKQSGTTTTCKLLRIDPVQPGYSSYGITNLDRDVIYDDGNGELTYWAAVGAQPSVLQGSSDLGVDNAESVSLMPEFDIPGLGEADIRAGAYDNAKFALYEVNYDALSMGHVTLRAGTIGQVTIDANGLSFVNELRGLSAQLRQSVCEKDSLTCRAPYGSQPAGSMIPGPINRFPCGKDATAELITGVVTAVGLENTLTFTIGSFALGTDALSPGQVKFLSGLNAGKTFEVDSNTSGGVITLAHETPFAIQEDDEVEYRGDCNKIARDTEKGCAAPHHWGPEWVLHFRGEPDIPIGDAGAMETPGASSAPGHGGATNQPFATEAE